MNNIKKLCVYIVIIVLYVGVSLALGTISFGLIQLRIAECLQVVCLKDIKYTIPLTIGCFLTNLIGSTMGLTVLPLDIIVGTIATCLSCLLIYFLRGITTKGKPCLSLLMPVIINAMLIGGLYAFYTMPTSSANLMLKYFLYSSTLIALSEFISCFVLGLIINKPVLNVLEHYDSSEVGYN